MQGEERLLEEVKEIMLGEAEDSVRDAALIAACQRVSIMISPGTAVRERLRSG